MDVSSGRCRQWLAVSNDRFASSFNPVVDIPIKVSAYPRTDDGFPDHDTPVAVKTTACSKMYIWADLSHLYRKETWIGSSAAEQQ